MPAERPASLHEGRRLPRGLSASLVRTATRATRDDRVELTLDPVELGKVRFDFTTTNDRMQVNLSVERSDTLDLLRRNADVLRAEFREAGFDGSSLSFSQWSQNSSDKSAANTPISETETAAFTQAAVDPAPRRNTATSGHGLDLRL